MTGQQRAAEREGVHRSRQAECYAKTPLAPSYMDRTRRPHPKIKKLAERRERRAKDAEILDVHHEACEPARRAMRKGRALAEEAKAAERARRAADPGAAHRHPRHLRKKDA